MDRLLLALLFLAYFAVAFIWPTLRVWRQTGLNPYVLPSSDDAYGFVTSGFRFVLVGLGVYVVVQALWPDADRMLGTLEWLAHAAARGAGWTLLIASLVWTVIAQTQMGQSWRIGIDQENGTNLVTSGLFVYSRNPIFLGMRLSMLGLVLLRPNVVTVAAALVADVLIQIQVRLEEDFLVKQHGAKYEDYVRKTRRWL
ncbi:MAG TPA: isoprenylcysteine carboxylmethyltransferase family protein [Candidimonas sp.]|nr:isoprenylcysteine carboxylmethyltransferase family protein [Candidimonas sp.]